LLFILANSGEVIPAVNGPPLFTQVELLQGHLVILARGLFSLPLVLQGFFSAIQRMTGTALATFMLIIAIGQTPHKNLTVVSKRSRPLSS
jgi:hypothetical protein